MSKLKGRLFICFTIILLITVLETFASASAAGFGCKDLTDWDPSEDCVTLDGSWEFYWNNITDYVTIQSSDECKIVNVPESWTNYVHNNSKLPPEGFATYRLHIMTSLHIGTRLGIYIGNVSSAYNIFINEEMVASVGTVSVSQEGESGKLLPQAVYFDVPDPNFDIIIQTSNYQTVKSGLLSSLYLGSKKSIDVLYDNNILKSSILYGALFIVMAFSIMIAILCRDIKYSFFLAMLCISMFFLVDTTSINLISRMLPRFDITKTKMILYSSVIWCVFWVTEYWYFQFKSEFYKIVIKIVIILTVCWQLAIIAMPLKLFETIIYPTKNADLLVIYAVLAGLTNIIAIIKGSKDNFMDGMEQLLCAAILMISALMDSSYYKSDSPILAFPVLHYALIIIMAVQMIMQAKQVRGLLEQQRNEELRFVQAQIKPYLLYSVINTYIATSRHDKDKARSILESFAAYLRKTFDIKKSYRYFSLREAINLVQSYIGIEQIRFENSIKVNYELPENLDVSIPTCMLQPIVENAVIRGLQPKGKGGRIDIKINRQGSYLYFLVKDNGAGMTQREISNALDPARKNSLSNITNRLRLFNRNAFSIVSHPNEGTEVSWRIRIRELND